MHNTLMFVLFGITAYFVAGTIAREGIINAHKSIEFQFPYQVSLQTDGIHHCGGGIIGEQHILTAAHCILTQYGLFRYDQNHTVLSGTNDRNDTRFPAIVSHVAVVYMLKDFRPPFLKKPGDIAVLKLKHPLGLVGKPYLMALKMPKESSHTYVGEKAMIAGYGFTSLSFHNNKMKGKFDDSILRYSEAIIAKEDDSCHINRKHFDEYICARVKQLDPHHPSGVCVGDSGSILVHDEKIAIGVLSSGPSSCSERTRASTYTRVAHYLHFIHDAVADKNVDYIRAITID